MALYVIIIANGHCSSGTSATANFGNITCYFVIHPVWWFSFGLTSPIICCLSVPSEHRLANWSHLVPAPLLTIVGPGQSIVKWEGGVSFLSNSSRPSVCHNVRQRAMSKYGYALLSVVGRRPIYSQSFPLLTSPKIGNYSVCWSFFLLH